MARPARILVVDDDPDFLDSIRTMLESSSYHVVVAPGEDEALAEIEAEKPDLLILDVMMAKWDSGFQFAWKLKADERYTAIPVLVITAVDKQVGFDFARHVNTAFRTPGDQAYLPVDAYIVKPVKADALLRAVKRLLPRARAGTFDMKDKAGRILIVDPDPQFAGRLCATLSSQGHDVEIAEGVTEAAQRLRDVEFDCVILDEDLPEIKGHHAVPVFKAIAPKVPVIMTAARNTRELEARIRREDVFYYHVKTFEMRELQMAVCDAVRRVGEPGGGKETL